MTLVICPTCGAEFEQDEPWKKTCLACWKKRNGISPGASDELLRLRAENSTLRQMLACQAAVQRQTTIEPDMLGRLIRLCHPDQHGGSESSVKATQWLLKQREVMA